MPQRSLYRPSTGENRFPCLCDLVNDKVFLEKVTSEVTGLVENSKRRFGANAMDVGGVQRWVVGEQQSGRLRGSVWRGESWREKLAPFLRFVEKNLDAFDVGGEGTLALYERYRQLFRVAGSSRILEIAYESSMRDPQPDDAVRFLLDVIGFSLEDDFFTSARQNLFKLIGDEAIVEGPKAFSIAIENYRKSSLLSPVGSWSARVNSAAIRLRMANSGSQFYQSVVPFTFLAVVRTDARCIGTPWQFTTVRWRSTTVLRNSSSRLIIDEDSLSLDFSSGRRLTSVSHILIYSVAAR